MNVDVRWCFDTGPASVGELDTVRIVVRHVKHI